MCDMPGCPANGGDEPIELTAENLPFMRVEATSAALHVLAMYSRGWSNAAHGIISDISEKWGFRGVTRIAYCMAQTVAILPMPENAPLTRATPDSIRERLKRVTGEEVADHIAVHMITLGDQVQSAFDEMVAIARRGTGHEEEFTKRFDQVTDQENMLQPLIQSLIMHAAVVFVTAQRDDNTFALDQLQSACREGIELGDHDDDAAKEMEALKAMFEMPEAEDR